jgi:hypothetical protein
MAVKKIRLFTICALFLYCCVFFLANSPLHIYLFHRAENPLSQSALADMGHLFVTKNLPDCPLCKFLGLVVCAAAFFILIISLVFNGRVDTAEIDNAYVPKIRFYSALAPPAYIV